MAQADCMDGRNGPVCYPVRSTFSRISTVNPATTISRQTRRSEYGRPASPVKACLRPPPSAADRLDRTCCPAFVGHQGFDAKVRLMPDQTNLQCHGCLLHKKVDTPAHAHARSA